jgi:hypothetical protein
MFVYYFVHIQLPFSVVEERIRSLGRQGLEDLATSAYHDGQTLQIKIGPGKDEPVLAKVVRIELGTPRDGNGETTIPMTWRAVGQSALFPRMSGDLVVSSLGRELTQLTLRGSYDPPFGAVGRAIDRIVMHRVAEASVKGFLDRLAAAIGPIAAAAAE